MTLRGGVAPLKEGAEMELGLYQPDAPGWMPDLHRAERRMMRKVDIVHWFHNWDQPYRDDHVQAVLDHGATPLITWEPEGDDFNSYSLGQWDWMTEEFGESIREHQHKPLYLRIGHEMNGDWYPWGGDPAHFRTFWERTTAIIENRAPWVKFVWCVNRIFPGSSPIHPYWPGPELVDVCAIDGYDNPEFTGSHRGPEELFGQTVECIRNFWNGPIWITECGTVPGPHREAWIKNVKQWCKRNGIDALIYQNHAGSGDYVLTPNQLGIFGDAVL